MYRSRLFALIAAIGMVAASLPAHAQRESGNYLQTVTKAGTQLMLTATPNPSNVGDGTPAVLQVSGPGAVAPTGLVTFSALAAGSITSGQAVDTAAIALDSTGKATWPLNLAPGTYELVAVYSGDANYTAGQQTLSHTVLGPADFSLVLDPGSLNVKQGATWSGNLTATSINNFSGVVKISCDGGGPVVFMTCLPGQPLLVSAAAPTSFPIQVTTTATILKTINTSGLLLLCLSLGTKARRRRYWMCSIGLLCLLTLVSGCGDDVHYQQRDGTPRGNYKMTFVGQSGSLSHAVSFVITVQ